LRNGEEREQQYNNSDAAHLSHPRAIEQEAPEDRPKSASFPCVDIPLNTKSYVSFAGANPDRAISC
jgi:hypothetical protein